MVEIIHSSILKVHSELVTIVNTSEQALKLSLYSRGIGLQTRNLCCQQLRKHEQHEGTALFPVKKPWRKLVSELFASRREISLLWKSIKTLPGT